MEGSKPRAEEEEKWEWNQIRNAISIHYPSAMHSLPVQCSMPTLNICHAWLNKAQKNE